LGNTESAVLRLGHLSNPPANNYTQPSVNSTVAYITTTGGALIKPRNIAQSLKLGENGGYTLDQLAPLAT